MKAIHIAAGLLAALCLCSELPDQPAPTDVTLNDFTDELIFLCLSFLSASCVASTATVSQRFNALSCTALSQIFQVRQPDGTCNFDPCKIYQHYHEVEKSLSIRALTLRTLNSMCTTSLSHSSIALNRIVDYFCTKLFHEDPEKPVDIEESGHEMDLGLHCLMIKHMKPEGLYIGPPSEELIDSVGDDKLRIMLHELPLENFFFCSRFIRGTKELRKKYYALLKPRLSMTLQALSSSEDVFDPRLSPGEIGAVELVALADYSTDEKSTERAVSLAEEFIRIIDCPELASAIECVRNTAFVIAILKARRFNAKDHLALSLILYMRPDAKEIFCAINDIDTIKASISSGDESVDMWLKIVYGIIMGQADEFLLPLLDHFEEGNAILGCIAAYHKCSPYVLLALRPTDSFLECCVPHNLLKCHTDDYATLDFCLDDNIALLGDAQGIFNSDFYWKFISAPGKLEYFEFMLKNANDIEIEPVLDFMNHSAGYICTDELVRLLIQQTLLAGKCSIFSSLTIAPSLRQEISREIKKLIRGGLDCSRMFHLDNLYLGRFQVPVFEEVLSWKNGFKIAVRYACKNNGDDIETNVVRLTSICLLNNIGFDLPGDLRPVVLIALTEIFSKQVTGLDKTITLKDLGKTFDAAKLISPPSSFHKAVAEIIVSPEYAELVSAFEFYADNEN